MGHTHMANSVDTDSVEADVLVVGYGPAGAVAAATLGQAGWRVIVIDRWPLPYGLPRLTHIDGETARIVQSVADVDHALRDTTSYDLIDWIGADGELAMRQTSEGYVGGFREHYSIHQPDIEEAIDDRIKTLPNVTVLRGFELMALEQCDTEVTALMAPFRSTDTTLGQPRNVRARYVIAADGANSTVRRLLAIEDKDYGINERWLNFDAVVRHPLRDLRKGPIFFMDPERPHMCMPIGTKRMRYEIRLHEHENAADMEKPDVAWKFLHDKWSVTPDDLDIIRQVVYPFTTRVAHNWRTKRIFLAGDAAHTMPPYVGQGACAAMRDGKNIAWKLDLVLRNLAGDQLLDTYETERRAHYLPMLETSLTLCRAVNITDPTAAAQRDAHMRSTDAPPTSFPGIATGVLHREADGSITTPAGTVSPQGSVRYRGTEGRFDDIVGAGVTFVAQRDPCDVLGGERLARLGRLGATFASLDPTSQHYLEDLDGTYRTFFGNNGATAFLSRPDFLMFGAAGSDDQAGDLVDEFIGCLGAP